MCELAVHVGMRTGGWDDCSVSTITWWIDGRLVRQVFEPGIRVLPGDRLAVQFVPDGRRAHLLVNGRPV